MSLTISLKTKDGKDPSKDTPIYVHLGGAVRKVKSALSVTYNEEPEFKNYYDQFNQFATVYDEKGKVVFKGQIDDNDTFINVYNGKRATILKFQGKVVYNGTPADWRIELRPKSNINMINTEE